MRLSNLLFACSLMAELSVAGAARAHSTFPSKVQLFTGSAAPPPCTICHATLEGGAGTANKPFAVYLKSRGLMSPNEDSLRTALGADQGEMHHTNGNPLTDIQALKQGLDPNNPAGGPLPPPPDYGCGARVAPHAGSAKAVPLLVAALILGAARRRKAKKRDDSTGRRNAGSTCA